MSSTGLIRIHQISLINPNNYFNSNEKHTINLFRLFLHIFNYIYLINTRLCFYFLSFIKRLLKYLLTFSSFIFVSLRGSRKKVKAK